MFLSFSGGSDTNFIEGALNVHTMSKRNSNSNLILPMKQMNVIIIFSKSSIFFIAQLRALE